MIFEDLIGLLKKKGFKDTLSVLINQKDYKIDKHTFYNELNKFSYYNSFFRVKEELIRKGLIVIENTSKIKTIRLTEKGLDVYNKLKDISDMLKN
jgi:predicted transcriptional regulator